MPPGEPAKLSGFLSAAGDGAARPRAADLFISNYALSELSQRLRRHYFAAAVAPARCGYVTWNLWAAGAAFVAQLASAQRARQPATAVRCRREAPSDYLADSRRLVHEMACPPVNSV